MSRSPNQKQRLLLLRRILLEQTDARHGLTLAQLLEQLAENGIQAERKSLYDDMEALRLSGVEVENTGRRNCRYYVEERPFQLAELKLLVDAVQSCKSLSEQRSAELIKKLESLTSVHQARRLQRQVYVAGRVKNMNQSVYYAIDAIHEAIGQNRQISFQYTQWVVGEDGKARQQLRHGGQRYRVSPWALVWAEEHYYLVGHEARSRKLKHYRVDKMVELEMCRAQRQGQELFAGQDVAAYTRGLFGMFGGQEQMVRLRMENGLIGVAMDRFGPEAAIQPDGKQHFILRAQVAVSPQFFGWLFGLGAGVQLLSPEPVAEEYARLCRQIWEIHKQNANVDRTKGQ